MNIHLLCSLFTLKTCCLLAKLFDVYFKAIKTNRQMIVKCPLTYIAYQSKFYKQYSYDQCSHKYILCNLKEILFKQAVL